jgi:hypothetical protein
VAIIGIASFSAVEVLIKLIVSNNELDYNLGQFYSRIFVDKSNCFGNAILSLSTEFSHGGGDLQKFTSWVV